jgi:transcriptional regulator with XRE-family HTH domain
MIDVHPLKKWRRDRGLTQGAAAEALSLTEPTLSRYETGARMPSLAQAAKLSEKTGIPLDRFVKEAEMDTAPEPESVPS